jgi:alpha-galactosidase
MFFSHALELPGRIAVETAEGVWLLTPAAAGQWSGHGVDVAVRFVADRLELELAAPQAAVSRVHFRWATGMPAGTRLLNDHWERGYGDLEWRGLAPDRFFPWYFGACDGQRTWAAGVQTQPGAFCYWLVTPSTLELVCDVRCGADGVQLGDRRLVLAKVVTLLSEAPPFQAMHHFCQRLCPQPRLPAQPVFGFNDWYYAYGQNDGDGVVRDAARLARLAPLGDNRPFCVIDAGWQICGGCEGGPWERGNPFFGDMAALAHRLRAEGTRPGLWLRLLRTRERLPADWLAGSDAEGHLLDPSRPEALAHIVDVVARCTRDWGYALIKHDFSTYDIFGAWGFQMGTALTTPRTMRLHDRTRTTAEIIVAFYRAIREAAGDALVIGCNTVGHLAAGTVEIQRTGDDTSGREWARTRKMGVNTLAFRMPQHGAFFAADADCVGLTDQVPWALNRQWLDLLAASGTPLFVSADPGALGPAQEAALRHAFSLAAHPQAAAEPLDWLENALPQRWRTESGVQEFNWFLEMESA